VTKSVRALASKAAKYTRSTRALGVAAIATGTMLIAGPAYAADASIAQIGGAIDFSDVKGQLALGFVALIGFALLWMAGQKLVGLAKGGRSS